MARNAWREHVVEVYTLARLAWEAEAEAVALGYDSELADYGQAHPAPRFKDFLIALRGQSFDEYATSHS